MKSANILRQPTAVPAFAALHFRHPFRKYQQMILDVVEGQIESDDKYHIVAPPGSGKTIVGLELIRRLGRPAVVFAPTTTIQKQWQEKISLFIKDDPAWIAHHTSLDASRLAEITCLTYQGLSTPGENLEFVERAAIEQWVNDLITSSKTENETQARARIATLQQANPKEFRREVSKRYRRVKREFLQRDDFDGRQFLHPNAQDLIDRIVALGTGTIVLDECHHLLDYWAFILRELIKALPDARVIGLTATLPDPENASEYENYSSLLGDVDFEVPTPPVVKEGNLAPYRNMVYFCEPSRRENLYLHRIQGHFEAAVQQVAETHTFQNWLRRVLFAHRPETPLGSFEELFKREPLFCIAGVKFLFAQRQEIGPDIPIIEEMLNPLSMDDWLAMLEAFALQKLKISTDEDEQRLYRELRQVLLSFGITITERGIRRQRSPTDLVLALSESKDQATVEILQAEAEAIGEKLRAVVITDFERMSARTRRLKDVLDPDAGSAVRVFRHLIADPKTNELDPILVTGKVVLADADNRDRMEEGIQRWVEKNQATFTWEWQPLDDPRIVQLAGSGRDWSPRTYVALMTDLFERGVTRCLVGTRGIFGEGWDALSLNTLVDLTSVTTRTGVQQIRGRSLRLDPQWPRKVAHNWDVVCTSKEFDKGDADLRRFVARHQHTWGIVAHSTVEGFARSVATRGPSQALLMPGRVTRGVAHVDMELAADLHLRPFKQVDLAKFTQRMLDTVGKRDQVYELWGVGEPYSNDIYDITRIEPKSLTFRTARTVEKSLRAMLGHLLASILSFVGLFLGQAVLGILAAGLPWVVVLGAAVLVIVTLALVGLVNVRQIGQIFRRSFLSMPADDVLLDIGQALLAGLKDAGVVSDYVDEKSVRVEKNERDGNLEVFVDYASPEDSKTFSQAYRELVGPLGDARYLIERDSTSLRNPIYHPLWRLVRRVLDLEQDTHAYYAVPAVLASHRERAEALAHHWKRYVGGGRLVYTRTDEGGRILLQARAQRRKRIQQMAFEIWT